MFYNWEGMVQFGCEFIDNFLIKIFFWEKFWGGGRVVWLRFFGKYVVVLSVDLGGQDVCL